VSDGQGAVLAADRRQVLSQALADALRYWMADAECTGCDGHPAWLCNDHAADLDLTDACLGLARVGGRWERSVPGHGQCWVLWPSFASKDHLVSRALARSASW
jgi:hypothetical protein